MVWGLLVKRAWDDSTAAILALCGELSAVWLYGCPEGKHWVEVREVEVMRGRGSYITKDFQTSGQRLTRAGVTTGSLMRNMNVCARVTAGHECKIIPNESVNVRLCVSKCACVLGIFLVLRAGMCVGWGKPCLHCE